MGCNETKFFVGSISRETTEEALAEHFRKYGEVVRTVIAKDKFTGIARGFGFVSFANPSGLDKVLEDEHVILGKVVDVKKTLPRGDQHQHQSNQQNNRTSRVIDSNNNIGSDDNDTHLTTRKIFVGGLPHNLTHEEFKNYFEKFGNTTDVVVMYDSVTHKPRGFGFITFDTEEAVENVMQNRFHELNDKSVEVKRAIPKDAGNTGIRTNGNSSNGRMGNGRYEPVYFSPYESGYRFYDNYYGYGDVGGYYYGSIGYGSVYSMWPYGGVAYGGPMTPSRGSWNDFGMLGARQSPASYNNPLFYHGYINGGLEVDEHWRSFATGAQSIATAVSEDLQRGNDALNFRDQRGQDVRIGS